MKKHALKFTFNPQQDDYRGFRLEAANEHGEVMIIKEPAHRRGIRGGWFECTAYRVNYLGKTEEVGSGVHMSNSLSGAKEFCRDLLS